MRFLQPKRYSREEMQHAAEIAVGHFKRERFAQEGMWAGFYEERFDSAIRDVNEIFRISDSLFKLKETAVELFENGYLDTLRYMVCPSVSADDFKNLSEVSTSASSKLKNPNIAAKAMEYLGRNLNTRLFTWLDKRARPSNGEKLAATYAVAALIADQKTKTEMRNRPSRFQEDAVRRVLVSEAGYTIVPARDFNLPTEAPKPGEVFSRETSIAGVKGDVVLGLWDGRFMALECKVSNTATNSYKRLNHESVDKVAKWNAMFGSNGVVGGCVLQGVFAVDNLLVAQEGGVSIFWSADLSSLVEFVNGSGENR